MSNRRDASKTGWKIKTARCCAGLVGGCLVGSSLLATVAAPANAAGPTWTTTQARMSDAYVDSMGVDTHLTYTDTPYNNFPQVEAALASLGIRHIRDGLYAGNAGELAFLKQLNQQTGITMSAVNDGTANAIGQAGVDALRDTIVNDGLLGSISNIEGPNEWDTSQPANIAAYQEMLYNAWRNDPATAAVPIAGPSFAQENNVDMFQQVGDLAPYLDYGNLHDYPGSGQELTGPIISTIESNNAPVSPNKPYVATETGYSTGLQATDAPAGNPPVSPAAAGIMIPQSFLQSFASNVIRTYTYELVNDYANTAFCSNFGLLNNDFTPKPAYTAIKNTISLLSDRGPGFTPGTLTYNLAGSDANTRSLLLQKRDGTYYLAVWEQQPVWNAATGSIMTAAPTAITLTLPTTASSISTDVPSQGITGAGVGTNTSSYSFSSGVDPVYLQISGLGGGSSATGTAPGLWTATAQGSVTPVNGSPFYGDLSGRPLQKPIVGIAATPGDRGYWMVASDGGIFAFGNAPFYGSTGNLRLNKPIVNMAATPDGQGYWLVASDGGIFSYGDARFYGSTGSLRLNQPIVNMAATPDGQGYWLVASDGGIFTYGDGRFSGSTGNLRLNKPIVNMAATRDGQGYWLVAGDGGIFAFGDAGFEGSAATSQVGQVLGMATNTKGTGYWVLTASGQAIGYGTAITSAASLPSGQPVVALAVAS